MALVRQRRFRQIGAGLAVAAIGLSGCTLLEGLDQMATPDIQPASGIPTSSDRGAGEGSSEPNAPPDGGPVSPAADPSPRGSDVPVPDPLDPLNHPAGEPVQIPGGTIVYTGLVRSGGSLVAEFRMESGRLGSGAQLVAPDASIIELTGSGESIRSAPFGDSGDPPAPDATITLIVDGVLVVFEVGRTG